MDDRDREATLEALTERVCEYDAVADAFLAKSFTDRLLVLDLETGDAVPDEIRAVLADHDLRGANAVYGTDRDDPSIAGELDDGTRHQFVDLLTRGDHQSYVVE